MKSLRKLIQFLEPYWVPAVLAPVLMTLEVAMDLLQSRFLQVLIDYGIARHSATFVLHTCPPEKCYPSLVRASFRLGALVSWWT
jgi:ABC-type multidrug transport system fused ATPase/permease subunit